MMLGGEARENRSREIGPGGGRNRKSREFIIEELAESGSCDGLDFEAAASECRARQLRDFVGARAGLTRYNDQTHSLMPS